MLKFLRFQFENSVKIHCSSLKGVGVTQYFVNWWKCKVLLNYAKIMQTIYSSNITTKQFYRVGDDLQPK